ncbi:hypothetical protein ACLKA6_003427 [Drosophila palustris]
MNFSWFAVLIFALFAAVASAGKCSAPFKSEHNKCVADRTIRGECPSGSTYKLNINKALNICILHSIKTIKMNCKWAWLMVLLLSLLSGALGRTCPAGFSADKEKCVTDRPVHGTCQSGSTYQLSLNKCVLD